MEIIRNRQRLEAYRGLWADRLNVGTAQGEAIEGQTTPQSRGCTQTRAFSVNFWK